MFAYLFNLLKKKPVSNLQYTVKPLCNNHTRPNLWSLLTDGRYSEVALCYKTKIVVVFVFALDSWSLFRGGR